MKRVCASQNSKVLLLVIGCETGHRGHGASLSVDWGQREGVSICCGFLKYASATEDLESSERRTSKV